jgi:hypothetical protein
VNNQIKALGVALYLLIFGLILWAASLISEATR